MLQKARNNRQQERDRNNIEKFQELFVKGRYDDAIGVLEQEIQASGWKNFSTSLYNAEEIIHICYMRSGKIDQGINFLYPIYSRNRDDFTLKKCLFSLALKGKNFKIAEESLDPHEMVDFARLESAKSNKIKALDILKRYINEGMHGYYHARSQILVFPEFIALHDNPDFQVLLAESEETLKKAEEERRKFRKESLKEESTVSFNEIKDMAEIYKKVKNLESSEKITEQLEATDNKIMPSLENHKNEVFALLKQGKDYPYYRLILAIMLLDLENKELSPKVIEEIKSDDFSAFPTQLFLLTRQIAIQNSKAARSFLLQLLSLSEANLYLPQHAVGIDLNQMLITAFGIVEKEYTEELYQMVQKGNPVQKENALLVLSIFQDNRITPDLIDALNHEKDQTKRRKLIAMLCTIQSSESKDFIKDFSEKNKNNQEKEMIKQYSNQMVGDKMDLFPYYNGISIQNPKMKEILFNNLIMTNGKNVSFIKKTIYLTSKKSDKEILRTIRSRIMRRISDEAFYDWRTITQIMSRLK